MKKLVVYHDNTKDLERSIELSKKCSLPLVNTLNGEEVYLYYSNDILFISLGIKSKLKPFCIDYNNPKMIFRLKNANNTNEALLKSIKLKSQTSPTILDATCGLARDTMLLASSGAKIIACEKSNIIYNLFNNFLSRNNNDEFIQKTCKNISLINIDSLEYIKQNLNNKEKEIDIIYLDPMFLEDKNKSQVKKESQFLRAITSAEEQTIENSCSLLRMAINYNPQKIVVKRPISSNFISDLKPSFSHNFQSVRYDIYLKNYHIE